MNSGARPARARRLSRLIAVAALCASLAACASVPRDAGYGSVADDTRNLLGAAPAWPRTVAQARETDQAVEALLARELTADGAMRVALLNSPRVRAEMEGLGIARADFLVAARPPNPLFKALGLDVQGSGVPDLQFSASVAILDLLLIPQRSRAGRGAFEAAKARAALAVVDIAVRTRAAFADYVAARQAADFFAQASESGAAGAAAAGAIYDAGNMPKVEYDRERLFAAQAQAARLQAEAAVEPARQRLNALMGLLGPKADLWASAVSLPEPPTQPIRVEAVEERAVASSFAVRAADAELTAAARRRGITNIQSVLQNFDVEGDYDRDDNVLKRGGGVSLTVPIFGFGGAERMRANGELRRVIQVRRAVEVEVRAQARAAANRLEAARALAQFRRRTILPLSGAVLEGTVLDVNAAQIGVFQLLQAQRDRLEAGRDYIQSVHDYWTARAALEGLVSLPAIGLTPPAAGAPPSTPPPGGR